MKYIKLTYNRAFGFLPLLLLIFLFLFAAGCTAPEEPNAPVSTPPAVTPAEPSAPAPSQPEPQPPVSSIISASAIAGEILKSQDFPDMVELNEKKTELFYSISKAVYEECAIFVCADTAAYEVAVIKAKANQASVVLQGIEARLLAQKDSFRDYMPEQYDLLENALLKANGDYILFVVADDSTQCEEIFDKYFS